MRQELLEFELKIKEIELQYGSKIDEQELKRRSMIEQEDLKSSGNLMKEIVKGQQQFFNDSQNNGQGQTDTTGQTGRTPTK